MKYLTTLIAFTLTTQLTSCGSAPEGMGWMDNGTTERSDLTVEERFYTIPRGSTHTEVPVALKFQSTTNQESPSLSMVDIDEETQVELGSGLVIEEAKLNIGRIKLKTESDKYDDQVTFKETKKTIDTKDKSEAYVKEEYKTEGKGEEEPSKDKESYKLFEGASSGEEGEKEVNPEEKEKEKEIEKNYDPDEKKVDESKDHMLAEKELEELENIQDGTLKWSASYIYDIVRDTVSPEIPEIKTLDGEYTRVEFKIKPSSTEGGDPDMQERSAYIFGSVEVEGSLVPFEFSTFKTIKFSLKGDGVMDFRAGGVNQLLVRFDVDSWLSGLDFSLASRSEDGVIEINEYQNLDLYESILVNMKHSTKFGDDLDGDGELSFAEEDGKSEDKEAKVEQNEVDEDYIKKKEEMLKELVEKEGLYEPKDPQEDEDKVEEKDYTSEKVIEELENKEDSVK